MRKLNFALFFMLLSVAVHAQMMNPVHFKTELKALDDATAEILFTATIDNGWHVYSTDLGQDGPIEATFNTVKLEGAELVGKLQPRGKVTEQFDQMFGMTLRFFEKKGTFVQKIRFTKPKYTIDAYLEYGACNDEMCMPPTQVAFKAAGNAPVVSGKDDAKTDDKGIETANDEKESTDSVVSESPDTLAAVTSTAGNDLWSPIISDLKNFTEGGNNAPTTSWWFIFLQGLLGGFIAILTPCVWPIIPMTVSFFLKRNKDRSKAIREAFTYGVSIIVIYVLLGLFVTLLFGASALNALSTNAIFNIFFAALLVVFAASFFGAFELTLPSSWSNKIDQKSESATGLLSIFLMAFTLTLVSFSCTGPIIGFLLVAVSTQGDIIAPTIGMLGFAIALAIPFTVFALFPSLLKSAPKSGGWMNTVKVVLGFIELAFALKFLSVADLAYGWHLLDREVFVSLWIVMFALLGFYLLGWVKFPHDDDNQHTNVPQFFLALISLSFAIYMIPGLWGAPLKAISAFTPPMNTQDFNLYQGSVEAKYRDYDIGMAAARAEGKPVMVDFTGFGCVNCRKMEAAVWTDPKVQSILNNEYILISLYVDDKTPLPHPIEVTEADGSQSTLRTVGDKWSYLQRTKIGANTQPFYVLLDPHTGKPLNGLRSYDEDIEEYLKFLNIGLHNYKK
ncbi:thioredoxin family protein [Prevotella sp. E9-3]|uniref:protein-disulfide reductase DsbD family protein n=1 Tax=Prevotella sp. E9-3 TaxID=2913621 RepID=UPI001EDBB8D1|nr:cytochrome c biogenesis protein CcdA [Prevotella sp. E9-3]UKK49338.1 thioredoxin family protein [Prevotella sp. E9-3]